MFDVVSENDCDMVWIGPHVIVVGSELDFFQVTGAHVDDIMRLYDCGVGEGTTKGYDCIYHEEFKHPYFSDQYMFPDIAEMLEANLGKNWQNKVVNMSKGQVTYF